MKPWEEKWEALGGGLYLNPDHHAIPAPIAIFGSKPPYDADHARAKLAAQAPAMARLLWRIGEEISLEGGFSFTHDDAYDNDPAWHSGDAKQAILKVLRAAGVLP